MSSLRSRMDPYEGRDSSSIIFSAMLLAATCLLLLSCGMQIPARQHPEVRIAVLPMYNISNSVEGPFAVREAFFKKLRRNSHLYELQQIKSTDEALLEKLGITLGSQLELATPQQIGEALGVDGLIYGYLIDFEHIMTGIYNEKRVRAGFRLVNARTGEEIWNGGQGVKTVSAWEKVVAGAKVLSYGNGDSIGDSVPELNHIKGIDGWHVRSIEKRESIASGAASSLLDTFISGLFDAQLSEETDELAQRLAAAFHISPSQLKPVIAR